jgi:hypothetical protein
VSDLTYVSTWAGFADRGPTERGSPQCQPFNHVLEFHRHASSLPSICAGVKLQTIQPPLAIRSQPTLQSPKLQALLTGKLCKRNAVLERRSQETEPLQRLSLRRR